MRALVTTLFGVTVLACGGGSTPRPADSPRPTDPAATPAPEAAAPAPAAPGKPAYPPTKRDNVVDELHGEKVADPYRWLEDERKPEVQAWMTAQNAFTRSYLDALPGRDALAARLKELAYFDSDQPPKERKGRLFWRRKHQDREKGIVYWKQGAKGTERSLLDPNGWGDGTTALGDWWPSPDGKYVAYLKKINNSDESTMSIIEVDGGKDLPDLVTGTRYAEAKWAPDSKGFYYTWVPQASETLPAADRPGFTEVRFHKLGTDPTKDETVFPATRDPQAPVGIDLSDDGKWLIASIEHGWSANDVYLKERTKKGAPWVPLAEKIPARFNISSGPRGLYVTTNDGAPNYQVFAVDPRKPARSNWKLIIPESDASIRALEVAKSSLVVVSLRNALSEIAVHKLDGSGRRPVALPPGKIDDEHVSASSNSDDVYTEFSSFTERLVIYKVSTKAATVSEWSRAKLPVDASQFETEQVHYPSKDGTSVSMFIVHKKGMARDGNNPTILYGYGGFNQPMLPQPVAGSWQWPWAVWLERGGVLALPNLRGGGEYGESWHQAGMLTRKQNVFDDYIAAARYLIAEKWTTPAKLAAMGRSNGGLLVGAAIVQAPELFKAVVCGVPLLDMVRFPTYGDGKTWIPEYGSPEDAEHFKAIYAYSPYHRLKDGARYPTTLVLSTDSDDRVDPMHARKFVAALQRANAAPGPVLLRIEPHAGHAGADMVKQTVSGGTDVFAFLAQQLGM